MKESRRCSLLQRTTKRTNYHNRNSEPSSKRSALTTRAIFYQTVTLRYETGLGEVTRARGLKSEYAQLLEKDEARWGATGGRNLKRTPQTSKLGAFKFVPDLTEERAAVIRVPDGASCI